MPASRAQVRSSREKRGGSALGRMLKGLVFAVLTTLAGILVFALLMQWLKPSDTVIRVFNQLLKLLSIAVGVYAAVGRGGDRGLLRGALLGLIYMGVGVFAYAMLSGQQLPLTAYLADLAMGVAGGGITGMLVGSR